MARWLKYVQERFPIVTYLLLAGCMCWSAASLFQVSPFSIPIQSSLSLVGILLFFFELRLMDEWKDFEKDKVAHPERPLPRGLLKPLEVQNGIALGLGLMAAFVLLLWLRGYSDASVIYAGISVYLYLMYREFFVGEKLSLHPFLYGFTHQAILIPLVFFPISIYHGKGWLMSQSWQLGLTILGAFFTYELCRKLDPGAHPVLKTYPQVYGRGGTLFRISITSATALLGSSLLHIEWVSAPPVMITWIAAVIWVLRPHCHKVTELLATISLLVHLACIPIFRWASQWT
jgi:hypothetical protein